MVQSILLHNAETWTLKEEQKRKLEVFRPLVLLPFYGEKKDFQIFSQASTETLWHLCSNTRLGLINTRHGPCYANTPVLGYKFTIFLENDRRRPMQIGPICLIKLTFLPQLFPTNMHFVPHVFRIRSVRLCSYEWMFLAV